LKVESWSKKTSKEFSSTKILSRLLGAGVVLLNTDEVVLLDTDEALLLDTAMVVEVLDTDEAVLLDTDEIVDVLDTDEVVLGVENEEWAVDVDGVVEALEENMGEDEVDAAVEVLIEDEVMVEVDEETLGEIEVVKGLTSAVVISSVVIGSVVISSVVTASVGAALASTDTFRVASVEINSSVTIGAPGGFKTKVCLAMIMSSCSGVRSRSDAVNPNTPTSS